MNGIWVSLLTFDVLADRLVATDRAGVMTLHVLPDVFAFRLTSQHPLPSNGAWKRRKLSLRPGILEKGFHGFLNRTHPQEINAVYTMVSRTLLSYDLICRI